MIMVRFLAVPSTLLVAAVLAKEQEDSHHSHHHMDISSSSHSHLPLCLSTEDATEAALRYHNDGLCDRAYHNSNAKRRLRESRYLELIHTGVAHLPDQLTVSCPEEPVHLAPSHGHDTKWIVQNKSSGAVVVAFVKDGIEYSVNNPKLTPPQADPEAILKPGDWMAIDTFEGHVFYVRELLPDGSAGNILLQHRPGLVAFKNRFQQELDCQDYHDVEPIVEVTSSDATSPPANEAPLPDPDTPPTKVMTDPKYNRTPEHRGERCNTIYQGFRNTLPNCPLHVYFVGANGEDQECKEDFKFHLGLQDTTKDYMNDWDDRTKFEASYMGHSFAARLASDPSVFVDTFTLAPTEIHDCPRLKQKPISTQTIIEATGAQVAMGTQLNMSSTLEEVMVGNATNVVVGMTTASEC